MWEYARIGMNIKEYEIYFQIVRKSIYASAEKGIFEIYSDISNNEKVINLTELNKFFNIF